MLGLDPNDASTALLWTQALLIWSAASYLPNNDPAGHQELELMREQRLLTSWKRQVWARAFAAGIATGLLPGSGRTAVSARIALALLVAAGTVLLPMVRARLAERRNNSRRSSHGTRALRVQRGVWLAEWEMIMIAAIAGLSWLLISSTALGIEPWIQLPFRTSQLALAASCAAIMLMVTRGGAFIVRGVLNKVGALPLTAQKPEDQIDLVEFNRGRIIGLLERFIVLLLMAVQAYQAIAFLMAAKGLIRSKDLETRDFAEYFLIGTLASMALALLGGIAVQWFLRSST
jgi:hypothetical protein